MLSSCANPSCSSKFRYLHQGKVFVLKASRNEQVISSRLNFAGRIDQLHYAWLCDQCACKFEVVLDSENRVKVRSRYGFSDLAVVFTAALAVKFLPAIAFCM